LPAAVDEVLDAAGLRIRDVEGIAVGLGPGSFTGLRIGLSYAKGIVTASRQAILGVSTFDAMALCSVAESIPEGAEVCPILDARKGEVYVALYRFVADALKRASEIWWFRSNDYPA
jgi:tRNA threonylcarbamoyladenosine biosynthesis protein TsaB